MVPRKDRAFWSKDLGFAIDLNRTLSNRPPDWPRTQHEGFADVLERSGKLPELTGAPVASWVVSRLFVMVNGVLGMDETEVLHNDGGGYWLNWEVFSQSFNPRGYLRLGGLPQLIMLESWIPHGINAAMVYEAFIDALLAEPLNLRKCRIAVIDMDPPKAPGTRGRRYEYGWDGQAFLGTRDYD